MALVDKDAILNSNPKKKLMIEWANLKNDYNAANALEYSHLYDHQSLSFILENSEMIFPEAHYGYDFYKNLMVGPIEYGIFHEYKNEREKVANYLESHKEKMGTEQLAMYESLVTLLDEKIASLKNTIMVAEYTLESNEDNQVIMNMLEWVYEANLDSTSEERELELDKMICEAVDSFKDDKRYFVYGPVLGNQVMAIGAINTFIECANTLTPESVTESPEIFGEFMEDVYCVSKMMKDPGYQKLLYDIPCRRTRLVFESFAKESPKNLLDQLSTETVEKVETYYTTPVNAVNDIFNGITESALFEDEFSVIKNRNNQYKKAAYDALSNLLLFEYHTCDNPSALAGYDLFKEGSTIEESVIAIGRLCDQVNEELGVMTEASDEDDDDFDYDQFEKDVAASERISTASKK